MSEGNTVTVLIKGIDMVGKAVSFEMKNNSTKGIYEIKMKVKNDNKHF